jgi:hypothetical protein
LIALTGWADDDRRRSEEAGFDAHLVKPVMPLFSADFCTISARASKRHGADAGRPQHQTEDSLGVRDNGG